MNEQHHGTLLARRYSLTPIRTEASKVLGGRATRYLTQGSVATGQAPPRRWCRLAGCKPRSWYGAGDQPRRREVSVLPPYFSRILGTYRVRLVLTPQPCHLVQVERSNLSAPRLATTRLAIQKDASILRRPHATPARHDVTIATMDLKNFGKNLSYVPRKRWHAVARAPAAAAAAADAALPTRHLPQTATLARKSRPLRRAPFSSPRSSLVRQRTRQVSLLPDAAACPPLASARFAVAQAPTC